MEKLRAKENYVQKTGEWLVDMARTAPVKSTELLIGIILVRTGINNIVQDNDNGWWMLIPASEMIIQGIYQIYRQATLRQHMKKVIQEDGYSDEIFENHVREWCVRQNTRTVLRRTGNLEEFDALCKSKPEDVEIQWLPHF